jgi:hypothetical protein
MTAVSAVRRGDPPIPRVLAGERLADRECVGEDRRTFRTASICSSETRVRIRPAPGLGVCLHASRVIEGSTVAVAGYPSDSDEVECLIERSDSLRQAECLSRLATRVAAPRATCQVSSNTRDAQHMTPHPRTSHPAPRTPHSTPHVAPGTAPGTRHRAPGTVYLILTPTSLVPPR